MNTVILLLLLISTMLHWPLQAELYLRGETPNYAWPAYAAVVKLPGIAPDAHWKQVQEILSQQVRSALVSL